MRGTSSELDIWMSHMRHLKGVLPKWHGPFQARFTPSVIPSEVEESLILTITSSKRCLDCARHDKKPIWATRPSHMNPPQFFAEMKRPNVSVLLGALATS